ncbi:MAG: hypothetical protein RLZZ08_85 [Pseudomonadota bacterium]|jgi:hypothetical protein
MPTLPFLSLALLQAAAAAAVPPPVEQDRLKLCMEQARLDSAQAILTASGWEAEAAGPERSLPRQCLGLAYTSLMRWDAAETAFLSARDARLDSEQRGRARLAAMAGNAALAGQKPAAALHDFELAGADAAAAGDSALAGELAADRARALVALGRLPDAATALEQARRDAAQLPSVWLLSATLARRTDDLENAQHFIETASALAPADPSIGLEAGLIAVLAGRDDAARASWQSVLSIAPDAPEAKIARDYLAQLEAPPQPR